MSESQFTDEMEGVEKKKSGIPFWVWGCGGGCLVMLIILIGIGGYGVSVWGEITDPEQVWPALSEYLPFDERPDLDVYGGETLFGTGFLIADKESDVAGILILRSESDREVMDSFFKGDLETGFMGFGNSKEKNPIMVTIQGQEFQALELVQEPFMLPGMGEGQDLPKETQLLLIYFSDKEEPMMMQLVSKTNSKIEADSIEDFFAPFNLGDR